MSKGSFACFVPKVAAIATLLGLSAAAAQAAVEAWVQRYNHPVGAEDDARAIAIDHAGNVIVGGSSDAGITGPDFLVIKYSGAGMPLWTNRYNGPWNGIDYVTAMAMDGRDNVFVTGFSQGSDGIGDYATVAYSSTGAPLWTNRYNGPAHGFDEALAVALDDSGNVFVTGFSHGGESVSDYATVAYSGAGVPLWTNRYNGPANSDDKALALVVDGNVYVTGLSVGEGRRYGYATVAYTAAGAPLWTNRYNGPANIDFASGLAVDGNGNVFVTGSSKGSNTMDYATVAYSGMGVPLWTNRYNGHGNGDHWASAVTVDHGGNVVVSGYSDDGPLNGAAYATVKYSGAGVPLWTNRYNGPLNYFDIPTAVVVDRNDNVVVTGYSLGTNATYTDYATVAYSGAGVPLWTNRYNGPGDGEDRACGVAVTSNGNVLVTGRSWNGFSDDIATLAYSIAGAPLRTNIYNGLGNDTDIPFSLAVDAHGNVFVTGHSYSRESNTDYETVAYSETGLPLWTNRYNGPGNGEDGANAVAVDGRGNVFVTGFSDDFSSSYDFATVAYSGAGVPLWTNRYDGPDNSADVAHALAVDGDGNVFVTGSSLGSESGDFATVAYSGAGVPLWSQHYDGAGNSDDVAQAVAVDASGNVFVTGLSVGSKGLREYATLAYSGAGVPLWTNRYSGPASGDNEAIAVAVDGSGNVVVTGYSTGREGYPDYATVAYSGAGVPLWTNRYNGPGSRHDYATALAVDGNGNVFVAGSSIGIGNSYEYATVAYSNAGVPLWTNRYGGPGLENSYAAAVAVDGKGNVVVTGQSYPTGAPSDFATVVYSSAGAPLWTNRYNGPANGDDGPLTKSCLAIGPDGAVYVTGASDGDFTYNTAYDYATIKYTTSSLMPIRLNYQIVGNQLVLSWTNAAFRLQSAPAVHGNYTDVSGATSPHSTPFSGTQRFFRLRAN